MTELHHNEVTRAILSRDLATDTARVHKMIERGGQPLIDSVGALLTVESVNGMNQKGVMRAIQAVSFSISGDKDDLDLVTASVIAAVMLTSDSVISYSAFRSVAGQSNMIDPGSINGVSRAKFMRYIGKGGTAKTIESKVSRSVGKRGFLTALGVVSKSDAHHVTIAPNARESGFVLSFAHMLQEMTQGALSMVKGWED